MDRLGGARLYLLATSALCRTGLLRTVREAIAGGVEVVQLREKSLPDPAFLDLARRVLSLARDAGALFVVNDRVEIAAALPCDGVHVGQEDRPVPEVRAVLGPGKLVGLSTHSREQAAAAVAMGADYAGVGPTFPTATKDTGYAPLGAALAGEIAAALPIPAFAIGGIHAGNLPALLAAGGRRIAVSGAILSSADPRGAAARLAALLAGHPGG